MASRKKTWRYTVYKDDEIIAHTTTKAEAESEAKKRGTHYVDNNAVLRLERPRYTPPPRQLAGRGNIRPLQFNRPFRREEHGPQAEMFPMDAGVSFEEGDRVSSRSGSFPGTKIIIEINDKTAKVAQNVESRNSYVAMVSDLVKRSRKRRNPVHKVSGGWQWGDSGKVYRRKADAERQGRAIHASGWSEKNPNLFRNPQTFVNYENIGDFPLDESFEKAIKYAEDEGATKLGPLPKSPNPAWWDRTKKVTAAALKAGRKEAARTSTLRKGQKVSVQHRESWGVGKVLKQVGSDVQVLWPDGDTDWYPKRAIVAPQRNPQQFGMFGDDARALEDARAGAPALPEFMRAAAGQDFAEEADHAADDVALPERARRDRARFRRSRARIGALGQTPTGKDRLEIVGTGMVEPLIDFVFDTGTDSEAGIKYVLDSWTPKNTSARKYRQPGRWTVKVEGMPTIYKELRQMPTLSTYQVSKYKSGMKKAQLERLWRASQGARKVRKDAELAEEGVAVAERAAQGGLRRVEPGIANYQETGIPFLMARRKAILADDMGLGKTYQAVVAANNAIPMRQQILVLCPAAVVGNWAKDDIPRLGGATAEIGTAKNIPTTDPRKARFVVCSYGSAKYQIRDGQYARLGRHLLAEKWGCVIFDEAHRLKHTGTEVHNFAEKLKSDRFWLLTGTPQANRPKDWHGLLKMIQHPLGASLAEFKKLFGKRKPSDENEQRRQRRHRLRWERANAGIHPALQTPYAPLPPRPSNFTEFAKVISPFVLRRLKETEPDIVAKLPKKVRNVVDVTDIPENLQKHVVGAGFAGKRMALAIAKVPATWERVAALLAQSEKVVVFSNFTKPLLMFIQKAKSCGIPVVEVRGQGEWSGLAKKRIAKLLFQGEFYPKNFKRKDGTHDSSAWRAAKSFLANQYPRGVWLDGQRVKTNDLPAYTPKQQQRMFPLFVGQLVAASEGITLHRAKNLFVNDLSYLPSQLLQAEDRIYRIGSDKGAPANIWYMLGHSDYDRRTWTLLNKKMAEADEIYGQLQDPEKAKRELERRNWDDLQGGRRVPIELRRNPAKGAVKLGRKEQLLMSRMVCPLWPEHGGGQGGAL